MRPHSRTINVNAECSSPEDFYFFMPWRYPGIRPVTDSCGAAGAILPGQPKGDRRRRLHRDIACEAW